MIIDAMDVLYSNRVDGFVLVSSDSDFTRLANPAPGGGDEGLRHGREKPPAPFIVACDKFVYIEVIRAAGEKAGRGRQGLPAGAGGREEAREEVARRQKRPPGPSPPPSRRSSPPSRPRRAPGAQGGGGPHCRLPGEHCRRGRVRLFMGELGNLLVKKQPDFDPRNFGFSKLTNLVKSLDRFEVDARQTSAPHVKSISISETSSASNAAGPCRTCHSAPGGASSVSPVSRKGETLKSTGFTPGDLSEIRGPRRAWPVGGRMPGRPARPM